jgi:hypothetical protein
MHVWIDTPMSTKQSRKKSASRKDQIFGFKISSAHQTNLQHLQSLYLEVHNIPSLKKVYICPG